MRPSRSRPVDLAGQWTTCHDDLFHDTWHGYPARRVRGAFALAHDQRPGDGHRQDRHAGRGCRPALQRLRQRHARAVQCHSVLELPSRDEHHALDPISARTTASSSSASTLTVPSPASRSISTPREPIRERNRSRAAGRHKILVNPRGGRYHRPVPPGRVSEWFMDAVLKTAVIARLPWVRIPPLPLLIKSLALKLHLSVSGPLIPSFPKTWIPAGEGLCTPS